MHRFSANLGFLWPDRPLLARLDAAAAAGFRAVELHWPYHVAAETLAASAERLEIEVLGLNTPLGDAAGGEFGFAAIEGCEAMFRHGFAQALDYASTAQISAVHVMAGVVRGDHAAARRTLIGNLAAALDGADREGVTLLLEPINQRDKPGYFYSTIEAALGVIEELGHPRLKLMFDCYHVQVSQGDVIRRIEECIDLIGHVQIAAAPSRAEPDEGELCYAAVLETLERVGYTGWIGCEYKPRGNTDDGLAWLHGVGGLPAAEPDGVQRRQMRF